MKIYAVSLGCPKNLIDTDVSIASVFNYFPESKITNKPEDSDLIIINTCAFVTSAVREAIDTILEHASMKRDGQLLAVIGCMVQRYGLDNVKREFPEVDIFLGTNNYHVLGEEILKALAINRQKIGNHYRLYTNITPSWRAYVKIAEGCSNRCTFCIIPKIRGRLICRPQKEILDEVKKLETMGVKEITLVAQDLTAYRYEDTDLTRLLSNITKETSIPWIRLLYLNPLRISKEFVDFVLMTRRIVPYFDVPIQHASERILRKMGRRYDREHLYEVFHYIRKRAPDAALRTTVMVGFPGETEEDFEILLRFIEDIEFDHLGVFTYSDEKEAYSHNFKDKVPKKISKIRQKKLLLLQQAISRKRLKRFKYKVVEVLVEGLSEESDYLYVGRMKQQAPDIDGVFYLSGDDIKIGELCHARVLDTHVYDLAGVKEA